MLSAHDSMCGRANCGPVRPLVGRACLWRQEGPRTTRKCVGGRGADPCRSGRAPSLQSPFLAVAQGAALTACAAIGRTHGESWARPNPWAQRTVPRRAAQSYDPFGQFRALKAPPQSPKRVGAAGSAVTLPTAIRPSPRRPHEPLVERSRRTSLLERVHPP